MAKTNSITKAAKADQLRAELTSVVSQLDEESRKELLGALKYALPFKGKEFEAKLKEKLDPYTARKLAA